MTASDGSAGSNADLATMLADLDGRLQTLQRELAEVALPITRRGLPPGRGGRAVAAPRPQPALPRAAGERPVAHRSPVAPESPARCRPPISDALVSETILTAEQEARRIVADAREQIAGVGARTRVLLEQTLATPPPPVPPARPVTRPASTARAVEERAYQGAMTVEAGPFGGVAQLREFEDAVASIPGIEDVNLRTFERPYAHFELRISRPTLLLADLRERTTGPLRVFDAADHPRVEILPDGPA